MFLYLFFGFLILSFKSRFYLFTGSFFLTFSSFPIFVFRAHSFIVLVCGHVSTLFILYFDAVQPTIFLWLQFSVAKYSTLDSFLLIFPLTPLGDQRSRAYALGCNIRIHPTSLTHSLPSCAQTDFKYYYCAHRRTFVTYLSFL